MSESVIHRTNLFGTWCGIAYVILLLVGWWVVAGFFPLHKPSAGADEIAAFFRDDVVGIRVGMIIVMWGAAVFIPFTVFCAWFLTIVHLIRRAVLQDMHTAGRATSAV